MGLLWAGLPPEGLVFGCGGRKKSGHIKKGGEARMELSEVFDKKLGFGCLRLPHHGDDASDVDVEQMKQMVDLFLERGFRYFDTAYSYLDYKSELFVREAMTGRHPREAFVLTTKLPCLELTPDDSPEKLQGMVKEQLQKCGVDYFDFYFLHSLDAGHLDLVERLGCFELLKGLKREGKTRFCGFSFHDTADVLDRILTRHPEVDVVQIQLNYMDWKHAKELNTRNTDAEYLYGELEKRGIPAVIMEPLLGGRLSNVPDHIVAHLKQRRPSSSVASWAFRFAGSFPGVLTVLSGMSYMEHLQDNLRTYSPLDELTDADREFLEETAQLMLRYPTIPCNDCKYCMPCPYGLDIPAILLHYNKCVNEGNVAASSQDENYRKARRAFLVGYDRSVPRLRQASRCIGCNQCVPHCPQNIKIPHELHRIDRYVEHLKQENL